MVFAISSAWADETRTALSTNDTVAKDTQAATTTYKSTYAVYKKDGYVYRADKNDNALKNGKLWTSSPDSYADVLFIDPAVTTIPKNGIAKYTLAFKQEINTKGWRDEGALLMAVKAGNV